MRLLCVDDSKLARIMVRNAADVLGHELLEATNGMEGLDVLAREDGNVDLVLLDWHMPVMDGMALLKALKNDPRYQDIPVMIVTTEVERDSVIRAIEAGAKSYLMKPYTQEQLVGKILESLGMGGR